jgi:hypothetical protein
LPAGPPAPRWKVQNLTNQIVKFYPRPAPCQACSAEAA